MPNGMSSREDVRERFARIVADSLRLEPSEVTEDAYLDDLGAESLDLAEISMETEEAFDILISQKTILDTATEVFGPGVLVKEGRLTEDGKRLLRRRMPDYEGSLDDVTEADLDRLFLRVGSWVRMIAGLMEHTPRSCPECDAAFGKSVAGRLTCRQCGHECDIPSGDEINAQWVRRYYEQDHQSRGEDRSPTAPAA